MRKIQRYAYGLAVISFLTISAAAQDASSLDGKIKTAFARADSGWQVVKHRLVSASDTLGYDSMYFKFKTEDGLVDMLVLAHTSNERASETFKEMSHEFGIDGLRMKLSKGGLPKFGDESFTWEDYYDSGRRGVTFRAGRVVVHINAPSSELATQGASRIIQAVSQENPEK